MDTSSKRDSPRTLAGGRGERLLPLTLSRPKPAISFAGSARIIDFTLANCLRSNIRDVALLTQYQHEELGTYVQFHAGIQIEHDRKYYMVSPNGIVVVSKTPKMSRPFPVRFKSCELGPSAQHSPR